MSDEIFEFELEAVMPAETRSVSNRANHLGGFVDLSTLKATSEDGLLPPPAPTPMLFDRRGPDRRSLGLVPEPIERVRADRRDEERRTSPRVPRRLWIVDSLEGGVPRVFEGEIGLGGASFNTAFPPLSEELEIRFRVPDHDEEVKIPAKICWVQPIGEDNHVHVKFTDVPLKHELAIARYLDDAFSL